MRGQLKGSLPMATWWLLRAPQPWLPATGPCCMSWPTGAEVPSGVWCTNGAVLSTSMWPWDSLGAAAPRCYTWQARERSPWKPDKKHGSESSPELTLLVVLSAPHKRDTEAESKAWPLVIKYIILGQWLLCLFSTDMTIHVTQLLVCIFYAWGHLLPKWPPLSPDALT